MNTVRTLFYKMIAELEALVEASVCANGKSTSAIIPTAIDTAGSATCSGVGRVGCR